MVCGKSGCGKTHLAKQISEKFDIPLMSFATKPKQIISILYGLPYDMLLGHSDESRVWRETKLYSPPVARGKTPRELLIEFAEPLRTEHNLWAKLLVDDMTPHPHVIIDDLRFPSEYEYITKIYGVSYTQVIYIPGPESEQSHISENAHLRIIHDYVHKNIDETFEFVKHTMNPVWSYM